ncbi:hypothetical protein UNPF46_30500 [Bradyrhizobium sp. UNPF46]|uniref:hypothetical protein n=1 Tax=Bradyrhizobium sp. UNPF46 TaxID=1141168 RepID=UPI0011547DC8|nr:hypothetical protein [Bradyrhizobium sp. UNPF46]TQF27643.1 hypothetical protein UNPF46_30500 [Bradyrhizobium sp. UNPF46]
MAESESAVIALLRPFVDAWAQRNERKAAAQAGQLMFWGDGMLGLLKNIAKGDKEKKTFVELKKKFRSSQEKVNQTLVDLAMLRGKLAGSKVSRQLDSILTDYQYGKSMIRSRIEEIIEFGPTQDSRERANDVCRNIEILNSELERLYRGVYGK